jgi:hypothetical protein
MLIVILPNSTPSPPLPRPTTHPQADHRLALSSCNSYTEQCYKLWSIPVFYATFPTRVVTSSQLYKNLGHILRVEHTFPSPPGHQPFFTVYSKMEKKSFFPNLHSRVCNISLVVYFGNFSLSYPVQIVPCPSLPPPPRAAVRPPSPPPQPPPNGLSSFLAQLGLT